jgi:hypothetical protein
MSTALVGVVVPGPTASADIGDDVVDSALCAVSTYGLKNMATSILKIENPAGLGMTLFGAAATAACGGVLKKWQNDEPATLAVNTRRGPVAQTLTWRQLKTTLPRQQTRTVSRQLQCSGWTVRAYYEMCVDYELDPLYN